MDPTLQLVILLLAAFLPPLLLAIGIRQAEKHRREPWRNVFKAFLWGATGAVLLTVAVSSFAMGRPVFVPEALGVLWLSVVLAPTIEETAKALGLWGIKDAQPDPEDGLIYGTAAGLGFAATENVFYFATAYLIGGLETGLVVAVYRTFATVALHGAASAVAGYGIWKARCGNGGLAWVPFLLGAIALHAAYNLIASIQLGIAILAALLLAIVAYTRILKRIRMLDKAGA